MNITKISAQNEHFGLHIGSNLEQHFKETASTLCKVSEGNMLKYIIDAHKDNTEFIKMNYPNSSIELLNEDKDNYIRTYKVWNSKFDMTFTTNRDNLWYQKLINILKQLHSDRKI